MKASVQFRQITLGPGHVRGIVVGVAVFVVFVVVVVVVLLVVVVMVMDRYSLCESLQEADKVNEEQQSKMCELEEEIENSSNLSSPKVEHKHRKRSHSKAKRVAKFEKWMEKEVALPEYIELFHEQRVRLFLPLHLALDAVGRLLRRLLRSVAQMLELFDLLRLRR